MSEFIYIAARAARRSLSAVSLQLLLALLLGVAVAGAADILVVGELQYRQVAEVAAEIRVTQRAQVKELATAEVKGRLESIVDRENARVVVALGVDAIMEALQLPPGIPVVYGLVISPPATSRPNVSGVYMSVPVAEYQAVVRRHLPALNRVAVVGSPQLMAALVGSDTSHLALHRVASATDLLNTVNRLAESTQAILLLPDVGMLTAATMEKLYLHSFRTGMPVLGLSEGNVKQGSLFALVFDAKATGRQIGEKASAILQRAEARDAVHAPPRKFNLFINANTARKMGISIPDEMLKKAKKVYN